MGAVHDAAGQSRSLLLVSTLQFGVHTDTAKYCEHLTERFQLTYICIDQGLPRLTMDGVDVVYCSRWPLGKVELGLLVETDRLLRRVPFNAVLLQRTKFSFLLRMLHLRTPMIFDVRSGSVEANARRRRVENALLRFNSWFFRNITVISEGLRRQLRLPQRARILPLAADSPPCLTAAPQDELRLIYIGTFNNRHLERTVEGVGAFLAARNPAIPLLYTIVGFGSDAEREALRRAVRDHSLQNTVEIYDRVDHTEVPALLAQHNVGVAFTPQVPWFEHQPSTKIYEYFHSGLLCVATDSAANRAVVNDTNGVLVDDTPEAFARGLERVLELLPHWRPAAVAESVRDHTWEKVVTGTLVPLVEQVRRRGPC